MGENMCLSGRREPLRKVALRLRPELGLQEALTLRHYSHRPTLKNAYKRKERTWSTEGLLPGIQP